MAAKHYLALIAGRLQEVIATIVSSGAADDGKIPALDATGKLDVSLLPTGLGPDVKVLLASEALTAGHMVNIWDNSGITNVRKADAAASGKEANGFVLNSYASGASATVYLRGSNTLFSGLTGGRRYYLSETSPGNITLTPPNATGNVVQYVGRSLSTTELEFEEGEGVILA